VSSFTTPLIMVVHDLPIKQKPFELYESFSYWTSVNMPSGVERLIRVPKGYRTDFASVPRFMWRVLPPYGEYGKAAVIHDYLCDNNAHCASSKEAADIFFEAMTVLKVKAWKKYAMTWAVKLFGPKF